MANVCGQTKDGLGADYTVGYPIWQSVTDAELSKSFCIKPQCTITSDNVHVNTKIKSGVVLIFNIHLL